MPGDSTAAFRAVLGSGRLMTRRYLLALGLVAVLSISAFASLQWVVAAQEANATIVNISGRQRMLSQRTALFSLRLVQAHSAAEREPIRAILREAATKMRVSHDGLTRGDAAMGLPAQMSEDVRQRYFELPLLVDQQVSTYLGHVFALIGKADEELRYDDPDLLYIMKEAPHRLLSSLDGLVQQYEKEAKDEVARLERVELLVLALTLIMLVMEARFIFRPMVHRVREETLKLLDIQHQLEHLAHHDPLTGLLNRTTFGERVAMALARDRRDQRFTAILCLDLDHFKDVNDTLGHSAGDELLKLAAERFAACIREVDNLTRLGGDEFAIVQTGLKRPADAEALCNRLLACVEQPFLVEGQEAFVGLSIGAAVASPDGEDPTSLLRQADIALYRAKADGRGVYRFFETEMDGKLRARKSLEVDLRRAISSGELVLHYQPRVDTRTGRLIGVEALVRWHHPERGLISPGDFISLAEETGLILPLGEWCLRTACAQVSPWGVDLSVNLSPVQFKHHDLVGLVRDALRQSGLQPARLELEITEGVLIQDSELALATLMGLRSLGVRIAMDDFGTGYSSLGYLQRFPVDKIKIDRAFVGRLGSGGSAVALVKAMVGLGRSLGIGINAEGVETAEQMAILREIGCDEVQGFLTGRPMSAEEIWEKHGHGFGGALPGAASRSPVQRLARIG